MTHLNRPVTVYFSEESNNAFIFEDIFIINHFNDKIKLIFQMLKGKMSRGQAVYIFSNK